VSSGQNVRQSDRGDVRNLVQKGLITGPGGGSFGPGGFIVNCPIISTQ
jgi:S-layer homology domain